MGREEFISPNLDEVDEYSTYLVNTVKSIDNPDTFLLITTLQDFHLVKLSPKHKLKYGVTYGVATTDVAIALQFDGRNFLSLDLSLSNLKQSYISNRMEYLNKILVKA